MEHGVYVVEPNVLDENLHATTMVNVMTALLRMLENVRVILYGPLVLLTAASQWQASSWHLQSSPFLLLAYSFDVSGKYTTPPKLK